MGDYKDDDIVFVGVVKTEPRDSGYWGNGNVCDGDFNIEEEDESWPCYDFLDEYRDEVNRDRKHKLLGVNRRMSMIINQICAIVDEGADPSLYEEYSLDELGEGKAVGESISVLDSDPSWTNRKDVRSKSDVRKSSRKTGKKGVREQQKVVISSAQQCQTVHHLGAKLSDLGKKQCIQEYEECETTIEQRLEKALPCSRDVEEKIATKDLSPDVMGRADNFKELLGYRMTHVPVVELVRISIPFIHSMVSKKNPQSVEDSFINFQGSNKQGVKLSGAEGEPEINTKECELMEAEKNAEAKKLKSVSCSALQTKSPHGTERGDDPKLTKLKKSPSKPFDRELRRSKASRPLVQEELSTKLRAETSAHQIEDPKKWKLKGVCLGAKSTGKSKCDQTIDEHELVAEKTLLQASLEVSNSFRTTSSLQTSLAVSLNTFKGAIHQKKSYRVPKCSVEKTLSDTVNDHQHHHHHHGRANQRHKSIIREHVPYNKEITSEHDSLAKSTWKLKRKINWGSGLPREKRTHSTTIEFTGQEKTENSPRKSLLQGGKKKSKIKW